MQLTLNYFLRYQVAWILDETRTSLYEKSRRIGITLAEAYRSVERRLKLKTNHLFASRSKETAAEFVEYCKMFAKMMGVVAEDLGEQPLFKDSEIKGYVIRFAGGARIIALSSNPDAFRGFGGDVTLDEFAFHKKQRLVLKAANACAKIWGHCVRIISSHNGEGTLFNKLIEQCRAGKRDPKKWNVHRTTLQDAVDQGLVMKIMGKDSPDLRDEFIADVRGDCVDESEWSEEYCCIPNADASAFLNYELIDAARTPNLKLFDDPAQLTGRCYGGYDVSRRHDLCVLWANEIIGDVHWQRMCRVLDGEDRKFSVQESLLVRLLSNRNVNRLCLDQTGMGEMLAERMVDRFPGRAEGIILSAPRKAAIATPFKGLFEDKRIRICDDDDLREDLHKTRKTTTAGGNIRLAADSDEAGHADRFWAGALCTEAVDVRGPLPANLQEKPIGW